MLAACYLYKICTPHKEVGWIYFFIYNESGRVKEDEYLQ